MATDDLLDDLLGDVLRRLAGPEALALVQEIRTLAHDRRAGNHDAERVLAARIEGLTEDQAQLVARAFGVFFDLVNIAEDRQRVRVLRDRERLRHPQPLGESLAAGIAELKSLGFSPADVQAALDRLGVELVFTAHPSEAKRRSTSTSPGVTVATISSRSRSPRRTAPTRWPSDWPP